MNIPSLTLKIGKMNRLRVLTDLNFGLYLDGKDQGEILMPRKYVPEGVGVDALGNVYGGVVRRQMLERHEPQAPQPTRGATWPEAPARGRTSS